MSLGDGIAILFDPQSIAWSFELAVPITTLRAKGKYEM